jgi:hypothetical protein
MAILSPRGVAMARDVEAQALAPNRYRRSNYLDVGHGGGNAL